MRTVRRRLAGLFGVQPRCLVWVQALPGGRYKAGCRQCGCGDVFPDEATFALFVKGHPDGTRWVEAVSRL